MSRRERTRKGLRVVQAVDLNPPPGKTRCQKGFASEILGGMLDNLKPGTAVLASEVYPEAIVQKPDVIRWKNERDIRETVVLCIGVHQGCRDIIELHFCRSITRLEEIEMTRCAQMLSEVFKGRRDGLVEKIIIDNSRPTSNRRRDTERAALLSPENPCGLTRAEWRLCVLVANGLSRARVAKELGITENTIRSHLRNIYSKTELETFHELALHMTSEAEQCHLSHLSVVEAA